MSDNKSTAGSSTTIAAILAMVISMGAFVASDSCMKLAMENAPLFELMLMRGLFALVLISAADPGKIVAVR